MVTVLVTGAPRTGSGRIEIIKENNKTKVCQNGPEFPLGVSTAVGSSWEDGKLSICSGYWQSPPTYIYEYGDCYSLDNGQWKKNNDTLKKDPFYNEV